MRIWLAILFLGALPASVMGAGKKAAKQRLYAVGEIIIEGNPSAEERTYLEKTVWPAVALLVGQNGALLEDAEVNKVLADHPDLRSCRTDKCSLRFGDLLHADRVLTIRIERSDDPTDGWKWLAQVLNFSVNSAEIVRTVDVPCRKCKVEDLVGDFTNSLSPLFKNDPDLPLCKLKVSSLPPGGTISVDTNELGQAPFSHTIKAGRHTISVDHDRFAKGTTEIDCNPGDGLNLVFTLSSEPTTAAVTKSPTDDHPIDQPKRPSHRTLLLSLGGVSAALLLGSAVALIAEIATDHDSACSGSQRCPYEYDNKGGIGLSAAGVGVFTIATGLLLHYGLKESKASTASLRLTPVIESNRYGLGLSGRF